jgi:sugar phosphate permease
MALRVLTPFALGYFLTYLLRAVNAVVAPDLVAEIGLSAAELGLLTAAYLGAFALFQLPLGVLLDRYGPRRVQATLFGVAALGCLLFAIGTDALELTAARALIGLGFSGGLMSGFKAIVLWVSGPRRALANACVMFFRRLGSVDVDGAHRAGGADDGLASFVHRPCRGDAGRGADHPGRRARTEIGAHR